MTEPAASSSSYAREPAKVSPSLAARLPVAWGVFAGAGTVEWLLAVLRADGFSFFRAGTSWVLLVSLWTLYALPWVGLSAALGRLVFGSASPGVVLDPAAAAVRRLWEERHQDRDANRLATTVGAVAGASTFLAGSVAWVSYLVAERHGAVLIALAAVGGQVGLGVAASMIGMMVRRGAAALLGRWKRRPRALHAAGFLGLLVALALLGLATALIVFWETVVAVQGEALLLAGAAVVVEPVLSHRFGRRRLPLRFIVAQPAVAAGLLFAASASADGRRLALQDTPVAPYLFKGLAALSDFDGDGSPAFPVFLDCAPFDPSIHPLALEIPGNGIDENCDGLDTLDIFAQQKRAPFVRKAGPAPNLVLITMDATRADHMGFMGYHRDTTPNLDRIAARSAVFTRAFSQDSGTGPSFWSLMTGKTPFQVKLVRPERFPPAIHEDEQTLAELLKEAGYQTEAVLCGYVFDSKRWNIRRGFDRYRNVCGRAKPRGLAEKVSDRAVQAVQRRARSGPFFMWVHYYDPHSPYRGHPEYGFGNRDVDRYDEEIRYTDSQLRRLYDFIERLPSDRPTYVALGADHGENFGEHGKAPHARTLYREVTHVPFVVTGPDVVVRRIEAPVAMNDLYPTFLELAGVPVPEASTMVSQVPVLFGAEPDAARLVFQENSYSRPRRDVKGVVSRRHRYLMDLTTGIDELYDYIDDPEEKRNLIGKGLAEEPALARALRQFIPTTHVPDNLSK